MIFIATISFKTYMKRLTLIYFLFPLLLIMACACTNVEPYQNESAGIQFNLPGDWLIEDQSSRMILSSFPSPLFLQSHWSYLSLFRRHFKKHENEALGLAHKTPFVNIVCIAFDLAWICNLS